MTLLDSELWAKSAIEFMQELQKRPSMSELLNRFEKYMEEREEKRQARLKSPQNWHMHWVFEILPPWRNLNTLGLRFGDGKSDLLYLDFFITWTKRLGIYINLRGFMPRRIFLPC